jgi:hypothetical protein
MNRLNITVAAVLAMACAPALAVAAEDLLAGIPAPANSTELGSGSAQSGGQQVSYSTAESPAAVITAYEKALPGSGWTVTGSGGSGGGYGGGAGLQATNGDKYLTVSAGGPAGRTFVHVCVWPTKPKDDNCGD